MPRGIKRTIRGEVTPVVSADKIAAKSQTKLSNRSRVVAMTHQPDNKVVKGKHKANIANGVQLQPVPVKRKIEFNENVESRKKKTKVDLIDNNNNAQVHEFKQSNAIDRSIRCSSRTAKSKIIQDLPLSDDKKDNKKARNTKLNKIDDGIKISVGADMSSDEEELDYEDDLMDEDEHGSIEAEDFRQNEDLEVTDEVEEPTRRGNAKSLVTDSEIMLGASSSTLNDEEMVMSNPHLKKLFNKMLDERIKQVAAKEGESSRSQILTSLTPQHVDKTPERTGKVKNSNVIKSPSDTTVYAPTLSRNIHSGVGNEQLNRQTGGNVKDLRPTEVTEINNVNLKQQLDGNVINHISNFVDQMRIEATAD